MNQTRELPRLIAPISGVSLTSYVEQLASMYKVSLLVMLKFLGMVQDEKYEKLNGYGVVLAPLLTKNFAKATRLTETRIGEMLLRHYDGVCLDLAGIDESPDALRKKSISEWAYFSGSHVCPSCIAESNGGWQLKWKLPWSFVCVKHKCYLVEKCPQCNGRLGSGRADNSLSPLFVNLIPRPGFCGNPQAKGIANIGKGAVPCGHPLAELETVTASPNTRALQKHLDLVLLGRRQKSMGIEVCAQEYFDDLKGLCALILHGATLHDLGDLPRLEMIAFERFSAERDAKKSIREESASPRKEPRTRVLFGVKREPALIAAICGFAVRILDAVSVEDAGQALRPLARNIISRSGRNRWETGKHFHLSVRVNNAYQLALSPTSTFNRAVGALSINASKAGVSFEPRHVPQLIWEHEFEKNFAEFFPQIRANYARRFCSMSLVKLCGPYTWAETAELLELPEASAVKMANRAVGFIAEESQKKRFAKRLHELAARLSADPEPVDYAERRRRLRSLTSIPRTKWKVLCDESGTTVGHKGGRDKYAAVWLWADLTAGDWIVAPGLRDGNITNVREVYRQLQKTLFPQMETALRRYGMVALLKHVQGADASYEASACLRDEQDSTDTELSAT